jgi:ABC-type lipoprotein release transport system permease subunit
MVPQTERILADLVEKNIRSKDPTSTDHYSLQAAKAIHYDMRYATSNPSYTIERSYLTMLGAIGLFLILAACINYTNLSTAMALKKGKEVGVRKTLGATRGQLMRQLLSETSVVTGIVVVAAGVSVGFLLPVLNRFLDKQIPTDWLDFKTGAFLVGLWALVSLLSGIYPSLMLSGFRAVTALKSVVSVPGGRVLLIRRSLVVFQFVTAQVLIICAIVVSKQMAYIQSRPLGFNKDLVVDVALPDNKPEHYKSFLSHLSTIPGIAQTSVNLAPPVSDNNVGTGFHLPEDAGHNYEVAIKAVDKDYLHLYGLQLMAGRWLSEADEQDAATKGPDSLKHYSLVLNETAVKTLGFRSVSEALGQRVRVGINQITAPIVGVVKDYHIASLHIAVKPVIMMAFPYFNYNVGIRLTGRYNAGSMAAIEQAFKDVYPQQLYSATFLDEDVAALYKNEARTQELFTIFTGLSIVINVLGLVGLLAFMIEQKTKEVGIRKVLGASVGSLSLLLSRDFLRLIGVAFLVAAPLAGWLMDRWLRDFAYRTDLSWGVFALALFATLVVTMMAIGFQTVRAAMGNPVRALRSE